MKIRFKALRKSMSGKLPTKSCKDWKCCMPTKSSIETSKVPIYSLWMASPNWETWMFPKWLSKDYAKHKLALLTIPAPRFGKEESMVINVMFGHWECYSMKCALSGCPSLVGIFLLFIEKSLMGHTRRFLNLTLMSWGASFGCVLSLRKKWGHQPASCLILLSYQAWRWAYHLSMPRKGKSSYLTLSSVQKS